MRLIDADKLLEKMEYGMHFFGITAENARRYVAESQTEDAKITVHGKWLICCDGYYPYCSECKQEPESGNMTNWCPSCGAKMDRGL